MPLLNKEDWDAFISRHPEAHILQTTNWGDLKSTFGWEVVWVVEGDAGAQILFRKLPFGYSLGYIPKGPVGESWENLWPLVDQICQENRAVFLKVEPDLWEDASPSDLLSNFSGFVRSRHVIQPPRTLVINLRGDEEQILARMKQKTRYNIRLALRKGVIAHTSSALNTFSDLIEITGERDEFGTHSGDYYRMAYELFHPHGACELFVAEFEHQPLAAIMVFALGKRAWYFYGASSNQHRNRMPTYLLQWEAIRWAREQGCLEYDLWGIPDFDETTLESNFTNRSDGLWGVYRFKRGFGGDIRRAVGPWDRVYQPFLYRLYQWWVSRNT